MNAVRPAQRLGLLALLLAALALPGCGGMAPVVAIGEDPARLGYHTVRRGDTLYSIAFRHGLDYRALAKANGIPPPYTIRIGQALRLAGRAEPLADSGPKEEPPPRRAPPARPSASPPAARLTVPAPARQASANARKASSKAAAANARQSSQASAKPASSAKPLGNQARKAAPAKPAAAAQPAWPSGTPKFAWPIKGKLLGRFSLRQPVNKGIDIAGKKGDPVAAAADGMVVYAGGNLRGYGKLVIIKHNAQYLTAYGNNDKMLVKEGDRVKRGDAIARMGVDPGKRELLHFEIREDGKPKDPLLFLPP